MSLARLWQDLFGVEDVGVHDNFFELGGHSLMAVTLTNEMERVFGERFSSAELTATPTIHQISEFIDRELQSRQTKRKLMDRAAIAQQVRSFISENYADGRDQAFKDSDSLLDHGILDPMLLHELVAFLEETYGITIEEKETTSDNLDSVDNLSAFVLRKLKRTKISAAGESILEEDE
jgi:acyl carrier protein